ncbi:MAG: 2-amino-4-hydroxy-6-hydroxymethyldihydropteridine diphosphokinase [Candidatus Delongbacteria bacterium]|nr:2-amino-4-hydroxy-6-hydroxymethyldihydropteridine diphosphokinase [Candidatus Delongbacteria bacterium]MBN2833808.1 2-amino-4-hydroxy-6-hydroxymethyldihydropteridine diphosphokinase [Candidatus Delongbacteria bacterium]
MCKDFFLSIGTNIGEKIDNLKNAIQRILDHEIKVIKVSSVYETEPLGYKEQDDFYNMVLWCKTKLPPLDLLKVLNDIENDMGRIREIKDGPRVIDIDIIDYSGIVFQTEKLTIPHPRYKNRKFVLFPLKEICPDFFDPVDFDHIDNLLGNCVDNSYIYRKRNL